MDEGINKKAAGIIANANNTVDAGPWTNWLPFFGDQSRHFNQSYSTIKNSRDFWVEIELQRAVKFAKEGRCKVALGHLGKGLHSVQDKYAHRDWETGFLGAEAHPIWYDDWGDSRNAFSSRMTEIATKNYLRRFLQLTR